MTRPLALDTLAQLASVEKERDALRALLQGVWDNFIDGEWTSPRNKGGVIFEVCGYCEARVTHLWAEANEWGGKGYQGYLCDHAEDCLVGKVEQALGIVRGEAQGVAK